MGCLRTKPDPAEGQGEADRPVTDRGPADKLAGSLLRRSSRRSSCARTNLKEQEADPGTRQPAPRHSESAGGWPVLTESQSAGSSVRAGDAFRPLYRIGGGLVRTARRRLRRQATARLDAAGQLARIHGEQAVRIAAAAQTRSWSSRDSSKGPAGRGRMAAPRRCEAGGGAHLVGGRLADLGQSSASASLSASIRWRPEATQTTGSPSATNTIDLAISASWQPTATAASFTVRVDASRRRTCTFSPSSRAQSASRSLTPRRALACPALRRPQWPARPATRPSRRRTRRGPRAGRSLRPPRS